MPRKKRINTERFWAIDEFGVRVAVNGFTHYEEVSTMLGGPEWDDIGKSYELMQSKGRLNLKEDGEFVVVATGRILRRA